MANFNLKTFKEELQTTIEKTGRNLDLTLIASMLMPYDDVKKAFSDAGFDPKIISTVLQAALKQQDAAEKRKEKSDEDDDLGGDQFERSQVKKWHEKAHSEQLHSLIDAAELRAVAQNRAPEALDVLKGMITSSQRDIENGAGINAFRCLKIDFYKIFPDLKAERLEKIKEATGEDARRAEAIAEAVTGKVVGMLAERFPALEGLLKDGPKEGGFAGKVGGAGSGRGPAAT